MKCTACGAPLRGHAEVEKLHNELTTAHARIMELERELAEARDNPITVEEAMRVSGITDKDLLIMELDECVHNQFDEGAANVNNDGVEAQLAMLVRFAGRHRTMQMLEAMRR